MPPPAPEASDGGRSGGAAWARDAAWRGACGRGRVWEERDGARGSQAPRCAPAALVPNPQAPSTPPPPSRPTARRVAGGGRRGRVAAGPRRQQVPVGDRPLPRAAGAGAAGRGGRGREGGREGGREAGREGVRLPGAWREETPRRPTVGSGRFRRAGAPRAACARAPRSTPPAPPPRSSRCAPARPTATCAPARRSTRRRSGCVVCGVGQARHWRAPAPPPEPSPTPTPPPPPHAPPRAPPPSL
jgi:hypothetical protein